MDFYWFSFSCVFSKPSVNKGMFFKSLAMANYGTMFYLKLSQLFAVAGIQHMLQTVECLDPPILCVEDQGDR